MKTTNYNSYVLGAFSAVASLLSGCSGEKPYSSDYDIAWPRPVIQSITPTPKVQVSSQISVKGSGLDKILAVTVDGKTVTVVQATDGELTLKLPRRFATSALSITNLYRQTVVSNEKLEPTYPPIAITAFPTTIQAGRPFEIRGQNVDLITSVTIGGNSITVNGSSESSLSVPTSSLSVKPGDKVAIEVSSTLSTITNGRTTDIQIVQ